MPFHYGRFYEPERMLAEARAAYAALDSAEGRQPFSTALDPVYGIFYQGWRNYLLAGILLMQASPDAAELAQFEAQSAEIAAAIESNVHPFLESYHHQIWPVDTLPAVVSIRAHTTLVDDRYEPLIEQWLSEIDAYRDKESGLLPHKIAPENGRRYLAATPFPIGNVFAAWSASSQPWLAP